MAVTWCVCLVLVTWLTLKKESVVPVLAMSACTRALVHPLPSSQFPITCYYFKCLEGYINIPLKWPSLCSPPTYHQVQRDLLLNWSAKSTEFAWQVQTVVDPKHE